MKPRTTFAAGVPPPWHPETQPLQAQTKAYKVTNRKLLLSPEQVRELRVKVVAGACRKSLCADYGIKSDTLVNAYRGRGPYGNIK